MNFLALAESPYEYTARGILYVIYEILWKFMYYILILIDEITKLFYKVAGINVSNGVVENRNMFDQLLNQNVVSAWYGIFILIATGLIIIFTIVAILRNVATGDERRSFGPILKNVGLATLLLIFVGPIILLLVSLISNLGIWIASIGGDANISIADIIFTNSGNLVTAYNEKFASEFTSFRELGNDFLYELIYNPSDAEGATKVAFHWYIVILGGGFVLYNLVCMVIDIVKRMFNIVILYVGSPFAISKMALDDGKSFKEWQSKFFKEFILFLAQMGTFMIFVALVNVLGNIDFENFTSSNTGGDNSMLEGSIYEPEQGENAVVEAGAYSLLNGLGRTLMIMAAVSVTRSSATMLTELLTSKEDKTESLLESVLSKLSRGGTRTRTITRNTTTTKRETIFVEQKANPAFAASNANAVNKNKGSDSNMITHHNNITQNVNVTNKFNSTNNFNNRVVKEGVKQGKYSSGNVVPGNVYINTTKIVEPAAKGESFKFMDANIRKEASTVIKEYNKANTNLTKIISSGDNSKLQSTLKEYTNAYTKEAQMLSENYRKFEARASSTMKSEVSQQTKQELKNITNSYRKAQMDYSRTANKLKQFDGERISTADALKIKEKADKQREILMSASNKAAQFYENQKKGE